jgi:hypothetical protein
MFEPKLVGIQMQAVEALEDYRSSFLICAISRDYTQAGIQI